jgi:hypothetical protein
MNRRQLLLSTLGMSGVFGRLIQVQDDLGPLKIMPGSHKLLFENRFVRVIESRVPAGGAEPKHRHPDRRGCRDRSGHLVLPLARCE